MKNVLKISMIAIAACFMFACKGDKAQKAGDAQEVAATSGNALQINPALSKVMWEGAKPTSTHNGTIDITDGSVTVENGKVTGGTFTMDMNSVQVLDLEGDYKAKLESHLKGTQEGKSDDFFNVAQYPTATFEITKIGELANNPEANALVYGNLTMKGITKNVSFQANIRSSEGKVGVKTSKFKINRTDWGIKFKSQSFFDDLKDDFIDDDVTLQVTFVTK